eukprot:7086870-Prymnesium_polylepis.1
MWQALLLPTPDFIASRLKKAMEAWGSEEKSLVRPCLIRVWHAILGSMEAWGSEEKSLVRPPLADPN